MLFEWLVIPWRQLQILLVRSRISQLTFKTRCHIKILLANLLLYSTFGCSLVTILHNIRSAQNSRACSSLVDWSTLKSSQLELRISMYPLMFVVFSHIFLLLDNSIGNTDLPKSVALCSPPTTTPTLANSIKNTNCPYTHTTCRLITFALTFISMPTIVEIKLFLLILLTCLGCWQHQHQHTYTFWFWLLQRDIRLWKYL